MVILWYFLLQNSSQLAFLMRKIRFNKTMFSSRKIFQVNKYTVTLTIGERICLSPKSRRSAAPPSPISEVQVYIGTTEWQRSFELGSLEKIELQVKHQNRNYFPINQRPLFSSPERLTSTPTMCIFQALQPLSPLGIPGDSFQITPERTLIS